MSIIDKFLDILKLNDDDYDDDFLEDDDDFDDYEPVNKKRDRSSFFNKSKNYDDDFDDYDDFEEESSSKRNTRATSSSRASSSSKVTPMRPVSNARPSMGKGVNVIKPTSVEDGREICETLLDNRIVILNLEGLDLEVAQRIIDFTSGATYAMKGNLQKISNYIFLVTPLNVDISGDLQDLLGNSFDVSSIRSRF